MKEGDFVYVDYIGRVKDTNEIFDLTKEDIAKREGVYRENVRYEPIPVIIGAGILIRGLEEEIKKMKINEKKTIEIPPEKGFGSRDEKLVRLIPISVFRANKIEPEVGKFVTINGLNGRILSISGGRVKVDFNHPLAGKTLVYEVEVKGEIKELEEKVKAIFSYFLKFDEKLIELKISENKLEALMNVEIPTMIKRRIANLILKWTEIDNVRFIEEYKK
jgi:FKBP-type peptidyl-prolyl cis-trans isomerase 2